MSLAIQQIIQSQVASVNQFPVDFDEYWQWLGFSTKGNAKRAFESSDFEENFDFCSFIRNDKREIGATQTSVIKLTVDCAKSFAMMARTAKGKEVRKWYLEIEKELREIKENKKSVKHSKMSLRQIDWMADSLVSEGRLQASDRLDFKFTKAAENFPEMIPAIEDARKLIESKPAIPPEQQEESQAMYNRMLSVCRKYSDKFSKPSIFARNLAGNAILKRKDFMNKYCSKKAKQLNKPEIFTIWQEMHDLGMGIFDKAEGTFEPKM